ncbi:MAG: 8-oxo-dGTP diphosphatase [Elusimicrobia bacterium]|nr:8-oxo-dGTP diphosphatase [Elusimicrobiota bacterium]MBI4808576.1 8-oxo-dGTP diphosphatase [Nitrosomonadales bacterium]
MPSPRSVADIDWETWEPAEHATLCFVVRGGSILLIRKKRGLGAGYYNGPGGRVDPGETPLQSAIREVSEELRVTPTGVEEAGELWFHFLDGYRLFVTVFRAASCQGEPRETDEAVPRWFRTDALPYDEMWADDPHWLPLMLAGKRFRGRFVFDGKKMLSVSVVSNDTRGAI